VKRARIPDDLVPLIEGGAATWMATRGAGLEPELVRVMGSLVGEGGRTLTAYLPLEQARRTLANLEVYPEAAIFFARLTDYRSVQVKGEVVAVRGTDAEEVERQARYGQEFADVCARIGIPRDLVATLTYWPSRAVEVEVRELYVQTPGPNAGAPWR
jgi:hypothetical protein